MFKPRERLLSHYVRWMSHVGHRVVTLSDGSVLAMFEAAGVPWESATSAEIRRGHDNYNSVLQSIATAGLTISVIQCRGLADPSIYPANRFRQAYAEAFDKRYRHHLLDRFLWANPIFISVMLSPPRIGGEFVGAHLSKLTQRFKSDEEDGPLEERLERLERVCGQIQVRLADRGLRRLQVARRGAIQHPYSEMAEAVAFAQTGIWRPVPLTRGPLVRMFSERITFHHETIEIIGPSRTSFAACLGAHDYPFETGPAMFSKLLASDYRCTFEQSFRSIAQTDALAVMTRKQNRMITAGDKAVSQIVDLNTATDLVASNRQRMGEHGMVLTVFADRPGDLPEMVNRAIADWTAAGMIATREVPSLEAAWASMIPGNAYYRPRPGVISTRNFCAMAPLFNYPTGKDKGWWGPPLAIFRTPGGVPYKFHLHVEDVGNIFVCGEVGSGKSTFLGFVVAQADRLGAQCIVWDKDRGLEILVRALGGTYMPLGVPTGLAPLKALSASQEDITFLADLIRGLVSAEGRYEWTAEEDRRLFVALRSVMSLPPQDRWLCDVRAFLGTSREGAGARLEKWCWGKEHGGVIDCPEDVLRLGASVVGFDQTDILDNKAARGPVMATLFYRTGKLIDGRRLIFVIDEFWRSLLEPAFRDLVSNQLKALSRKGNAPVLLGTQSPSDALNSPIGHTIREQTPTKISFANAGALMEDYCGANSLGYSRREFELIKTMPKGQGLFYCKQGPQGVLLQLPLGKMPDDIAVLSGRKETVKILDRARDHVGDADPIAMIEEFHRLRREGVPA